MNVKSQSELDIGGLESCSFYSVSIWPSWSRYAVAKAQNSNFGDGSCAVWLTTQAKASKLASTLTSSKSVCSFEP